MAEDEITMTRTELEKIKQHVRKYGGLDAIHLAFWIYFMTTIALSVWSWVDVYQEQGNIDAAWQSALVTGFTFIFIFFVIQAIHRWLWKRKFFDIYNFFIKKPS